MHSLPNSILKDPKLQRYVRFVQTPTEQPRRRRRGFRREEIRSLHAMAVERPEVWELYRAVRVVEQADLLHPRVPQRSIEELRALIARRDTHEWGPSGDRKSMTVIYLYWPAALLLDCERRTPEGSSYELVVTLLLDGPQNEQTAATMFRALQPEAPALLQRFPGNTWVQEVAFGPADRGVTYTLYITTSPSSGCRVLGQWAFPLAVAYQPLLQSMAGRYRVDAFDPPRPRREVAQRYESEVFAEAMSALWQAACAYDERRTNIPLAAYLERQVRWRLGDAVDRQSSRFKADGRDKARPRLKADIERSGGSLDAGVKDDEGQESQLVERLLPGVLSRLPELTEATPIGPLRPSDPSVAEHRLLITELLTQGIPDARDRWMFLLSLEGHTQKEIARAGGVDQTTVSRRLQVVKVSLQRLSG